MSKSRRFIPALLAVVMLLIGTMPALAGPPQVVEGPIDPWTIPAGQCDEAPGGLTGTGVRHQVINTSVKPDGSTQIVINDTVKGTATDLDGGGSYSYIYSNHSIEVIPAGGGAHQVSMVDSFVINGQGDINHMKVGFNWRWTYEPPAPMWPPVDNWEKISTNGDPMSCDPI